MKKVYLKEDFSSYGKYAVALGLFDGIHKGHLKILDKTLEYKKKGLDCAVLTFNLTDRIKTSALRLSSDDEKEREFERLGFDFLFILDFEKVKEMTGKEFTEKVLKNIGAEVAVCGEDFRFGKGAKENALDLKEYMGGAAEIVEKEKKDGRVISSSSIRDYISKGEIEEANSLLVNPFTLSGEVVHGCSLGRTLGYPTINQKIAKGALLPKKGVYATRTRIEEKSYPSVTNIGTRPTFSGDALTLETHIIGENLDLYGKIAHLEFIKFIREEKKFSSKEELKERIEKDIEEAKKYDLD